MAYISQYSGEKLDQSITDVSMLNEEITTKVNKSGDTMTGQLITPSVRLVNEYPYINFMDQNGIKRGEIYNSEKGIFNIRQMSANNSGYYDSYYLPNPGNLTANKDYVILTSKNYLNLIYPVGSVYTTSTNTNPSSTLGGTWSLIDKKFAYASLDAANCVTLNSTNCSEVAGKIIRMEHTLWFYISFVPKVAITDSTLAMFTFKLDSLGVSGLTNFHFSSMTDGGQAVFTFNINASGQFSTTDVIVRNSGTANLATGYTLVAQCDTPVSSSQILDSAANQFVWKRTA